VNFYIIMQNFTSFIVNITKNIHIIACGTSFHSGLVAKYWIEEYANIPCQVEVASEYRYRKVPVPEGTLFVTISQSGETADTLSALRKAKENGYLGFLAICNVANSSLVRESDISLMTLAGPEIGVASTKAFTTQLVALQLLSLSLAKHNGLDAETEKELVENLHQLPQLCSQILALDPIIEAVSESFANKHHALFLGRGEQYPIALEGALKLKEISYIHAEAYPSGELKHGPLALVDEDMPVVTVAPNNQLLEKLKSNLHEVRARGGQLFVFADVASGFVSEPGTTVIDMPHVPKSLEAIIYTLPLQMLSYHVALLKGTDVDQPRNLAKSVTVE
jgi:glucosamine--fructose-6-phosphate aminotransferase (isomerizing)